MANKSTAAVSARASSQAALMFASFLGAYVYGSIATLIGQILPRFSQTIGLDPAQQGTLIMLNSWGLVLGSFIIGPLIDKIGYKFANGLGLALVVLALGMLSASSTYGLALTSAMILGVGGSCVVSGMHALVSELNPEKRGAALNLLDVFFGLGAFVTPFIAGPLLERGALTALIHITAGVTVLVLLYYLALRYPQASHAHEFSLKEAASVLGKLSLWLPGILLFLYAGSEVSVWSWGKTYFMQHLNASETSSSRIIAAVAVAIMIGRLAASRLLLVVSGEKLILYSVIGSTISLLLALNTSRVSAAGILIFVVGLFYASIYPTAVGIVAQRFQRFAGTAISLSITFGWLGAVAIPPAIGYVAKGATIHAGMMVLMAATAAMVAVHLILMVYFRRAQERSRDGGANG